MSAPTAASPPLPLRNCYWVVPGLLLAGEHPNGPTRDKTKDRLGKLLAAGIECFVDLTKPTELPRYDTYLPFYVEYARKSIKDHGLPGSRAQMTEILDYVANSMRAGRPVYLHCRAGIGRTGTVIGCLLVERGLPGDGALDELNRLWQQSRRSKSWAFIPETEAQATYVRQWEPALGSDGFDLSSLATAVATVGPMTTAGSVRQEILAVADVPAQSASPATHARAARATGVQRGEISPSVRAEISDAIATGGPASKAGRRGKAVHRDQSRAGAAAAITRGGRALAADGAGRTGGGTVPSGAVVPPSSGVGAASGASHRAVPAGRVGDGAGGLLGAQQGVADGGLHGAAARSSGGAPSSDVGAVSGDPLLDPSTLALARGLRERFVGTLFGLAIGDAVAAATQFRRPGSFTPIGDMIGGGPFDLPRGAWSDDTAMALCLAESLLERDGFDARDQVQRYSRWQQEGYLSSTGQCVGITASTARSLALAKWRRVVFPGSHDPEQLDPEPLSRVASIALFYLASLEATLAQAADASRTTCQAPAVLDACRWLARGLSAALFGQPKARILADIGPIAGSAVEAQTNNTAATALAASLWAFGSTDNFRDAVLRAANVGGNSDVVAAVCGQIAGAHYGASAIPQAWRNGLIQKDLIEGYADRLLAHSLVRLSS